ASRSTHSMPRTTSLVAGISRSNSKQKPSTPSKSLAPGICAQTYLSERQSASQLHVCMHIPRSPAPPPLNTGKHEPSPPLAGVGLTEPQPPAPNVHSPVQ